ncbi:hypothetical protein [Quatrionicoccus australiensis]|uniref:hypothetical protein n=1 Tax=Quatrionicoccus australiensis TaxID=138118 RepID=UPI001CF843D8|nr:hypothetical protein [Quatrionicoccus australiensis]UCV13411.1 hypothetical protein KI612_10520 [Quatrionicoccus australiensis]
MSNTQLRERVGSQTLMSRVENGSDTLLIVFSPAYFTQRKLPYHYKRAVRLNISVIIFEGDSDFFCTDWLDIIYKISDVARGYDKVISYGFSMGGYAAVRLALELDKIPNLTSCYGVSAHLKLSDRHSRAQAIWGGDAPNLANDLLASEKLPSVFMIFPVQSINDSIHLEDSSILTRPEIKIFYINTGHGIEPFLKSQGALDSFFDDIYHLRSVSFPPDIIANTEQIRRALMTLPWLREFEGEPQTLPIFFDEDVMDSVWHFKKSIVYFKRKDWDSFWISASRCAKLAGADNFWINDYFNIFNDDVLPDRMAAGVLQLGLRYSMELVDRIIETSRYSRIISDQVDVMGLALLAANRDCVPSEILNRFFKCNHLSDLQVIFMSVLSRQNNFNAKYLLSRHAFEAGYYAAARHLLSFNLDSVDVAAAWEVYFLIGNVLLATGENDEAKAMFERAENLTTNSLPQQALVNLMGTKESAK